MSAVRFGAGVTREVGADLQTLGVRRALVITDPDRGAAGGDADRPRIPRGRRHRLRRLRSRPRRADRRILPGSDRVRPAQQRRRLRGGRRRFRDRHRQGREPLLDVSSRRFPRLRQSADRQGPAGAGTAQAAHRGSDHRGHRQRNDRGQHLRSDPAARQDRHRQPPAQADARPGRSGEHENAAAGGGRVERTRHPQPRARVVHRAALHGASAAGPSFAQARLSGLEPDQRRLVAAGAATGEPIPRPRRRRPGGRRGAGEHAAGGVVRRHRLRECRRAPAARHVVSRVRPGARLSGAGLRRSIIRSCRTASR